MSFIEENGPLIQKMVDGFLEKSWNGFFYEQKKLLEVFEETKANLDEAISDIKDEISETACNIFCNMFEGKFYRISAEDGLPVIQIVGGMDENCTYDPEDHGITVLSLKDDIELNDDQEQYLLYLKKIFSNTINEIDNKLNNLKGLEG